MSEEAKLEKLEARHSMLSVLQQQLDPNHTTEEDKLAAENLREDIQQSDKEYLFTAMGRRPYGVFTVLHDVARQNGVFNQSEAKAFFGERACLARINILFEHMKEFIDEVRIAEKFLPGHLGHCGDLWNEISIGTSWND